jgi:LuxR family maltose regulon positive regulatory protein
MATSRAVERIQQSKLLRPAPGIWELQRPRLIERLNEGRTSPLSIICGMAGSGKTTLARQWATQLDRSAAWITLDESDNELGRFVHLLVAAVRTVWPQFGAATLSDLRIGDRLSAGDLAIVFCDEVIALGAPVVVIIDELQAIHTTAIYDFLSWVFRLPPPNLHLCLVSRTDPPLPLIRYRAHVHLTEIRLAQLLLSLDETREFLLDVAHAALSPEAVRNLHDETEGWITGLHLTALAIRDAGSEPDASILHQRASLDSMEFLANEVVARVPESMQRRMVLLAVPERINAELSWHLLHASPDDAGVDVEAMLAHLEASGYFLVSLGDDRIWYRFHPLFRDALLDTTTRRFGAETIRTGHRLAADWFSTNHYIDQAIRHSLAAGDIDQAAELVEKHAQHALATDNWLALEWWIQQLPHPFGTSASRSSWRKRGSTSSAEPIARFRSGCNGRQRCSPPIGSRHGMIAPRSTQKSSCWRPSASQIMPIAPSIEPPGPGRGKRWRRATGLAQAMRSTT